jgi:hypothetical protein
MGDYKYSEAKSLPPLSEINSDTAVRDFIEAIKGYHDDLNDDGKKKLIKFILTAKVQGTAKTKIGDEKVEDLGALTGLLLTRCGSTETEASLSKKF